MSGPGGPDVPDLELIAKRLAPLLALHPKCEACGLPWTGGRGEPWPSCRCNLDEGILGESPEWEGP